MYDVWCMYGLLRVVQAFDPQFAARHVTPAWIDDLAVVTPLAIDGGGCDLAKLKEERRNELPAYFAVAQNASYNVADVEINSPLASFNGGAKTESSSLTSH